LIIGLTFIPIGIVLVVTSNRVLEFDLDYTDTNCIQQGTSTRCSDVISYLNGSSCTCTRNFTLDQDYTGDVYFYYGLINYYQNHRRYVKSRDDNQLLGKATPAVSDCSPYQTDTTGTKSVAPCGAIANSLFNDTLSLQYQGTIDVPMNNTGIAWSTDKNVKFRNPSSPTDPNYAQTYFTNLTVKPPYWNETAWQLDPDNEDNNGFQNEDFIVWMRTAAMPTFRKLYRRLTPNSTETTFTNGLPKGVYVLTIEYNYPVTTFAGRKQFIISTTSWMGGKNPFLGWAYIVVGIVCIIVSVVFFILHRFWKVQNRENTM